MKLFNFVFNEVVDFYKKLFSGEIDFSPKKIDFTPEEKEKIKKQISDEIYKNKESIKKGDLENILKQYIDPNKIVDFFKTIKDKKEITKEEFKKLL